MPTTISIEEHVRNIVRIVKSTNPNLRIIEFTIIADKKHLSKEDIFKHIFLEEDREQAAYLRGWVDCKNFLKEEKEKEG